MPGKGDTSPMNNNEYAIIKNAAPTRSQEPAHRPPESIRNIEIKNLIQSPSITTSNLDQTIILAQKLP